MTPDIATLFRYRSELIGKHMPSDIVQYGKYKLPKGSRKELVLYSYNRAQAEMPDLGLILVEEFFSVLKLFEAGFPNVVSAMGCEVSEQQLELLARAPEVVVLFDGNVAGREGAERVRQNLEHRTVVCTARRKPSIWSLRTWLGSPHMRRRAFE